MRHKLTRRGERRHATEHAVVLGREIAQHDADGRLVKVFDIVGCNAHSHRAAPVGNVGQFGTQVIQNVLRMGGIVVGNVKQRQCGRSGIRGQGQAAAASS